MRRPLESAPQIGLGWLCQFAVPRIGQPDAAGDVEPRLVAPDRAGGKIWRLRRTRQHVDKNTAACAPDRLGLRRRKDAYAGEGRRNSRAIVIRAISVRLPHILLRENIGCRGKRCEGNGRNDHARQPSYHGDFFAVSAPIGRSFSSSKGAPKSSSILLIAGWFSW